MNSTTYPFLKSPTYPKKVLTDYTLVAEPGMLEFIEEVSLHFDAGWELAGPAQLLSHDFWEELRPKPETRFCVQLVRYEWVDKPIMPESNFSVQ